MKQRLKKLCNTGTMKTKSTNMKVLAQARKTNDLKNEVLFSAGVATGNELF